MHVLQPTEQGWYDSEPDLSKLGAFIGSCEDMPLREALQRLEKVVALSADAQKEVKKSSLTASPVSTQNADFNLRWVQHLQHCCIRILFILPLQCASSSCISTLSASSAALKHLPPQLCSTSAKLIAHAILVSSFIPLMLLYVSVQQISLVGVASGPDLHTSGAVQELLGCNSAGAMCVLAAALPELYLSGSSNPDRFPQQNLEFDLCGRMEVALDGSFARCDIGIILDADPASGVQQMGVRLRALAWLVSAMQPRGDLKVVLVGRLFLPTGVRFDASQQEEAMQPWNYNLRVHYV